MGLQWFDAEDRVSPTPLFLTDWLSVYPVPKVGGQRSHLGVQAIGLSANVSTEMPVYTEMQGGRVVVAKTWTRYSIFLV